MTTSPDVLDLHSLAVLINYEKTSSDPRFRFAKLREVASPDGKFKSVILPDNTWEGVATSQPKHAFLFDTVQSSDQYNLPENMLSPRADPSLCTLTERQLETIFYQARGQNGCFQAIAILQNLADLYDDDQPLRVRLRDGTDFITPLSNRSILEFTLQAPKQTTISIAGSPTQFHYTGEGPDMIHAIWGFTRAHGDRPTAVLDLASMQFGTAGRGLSGDFFVLEAMDGWDNFVEQVAQGGEMIRSSQRIRSSGDPVLEEWFKSVAERVKDRWNAREIEHWCALCGKPNATKRCGRCQQQYYCSESHSKASWKNWHKKWCTPRN